MHTFTDTRLEAALAARIRDIPMPPHMRRRPIVRGFPVPFFVAWLSPMGTTLPDGLGEPDFRVIDQAKVGRCLKWSLCFLCGQPLGKFRALVAGPMCLVTRINPDPDCHVDCAEYAAQACPFLANDQARRNNARPLPPGAFSHPDGHKRNPGVAAVFVHHERWLKRYRHGGATLFHIPAGEPRRLTFWAQGRRATRAEVMSSLNSGLPILQDGFEKQHGASGRTELACYYAATVALIERWTEDIAQPVNDDRPA